MAGRVLTQSYVYATTSPRLRWARRVRRRIQRDVPHFFLKCMVILAVVVIGVAAAQW